MNETAYLVMHWDYDQSAPIAVFDDEAKAREYARMLNVRGDSGYAVEELPFKRDVPREYVRWMGYTFKYLYVPEESYTHNSTSHVGPLTWDDLDEDPAPILLDKLEKFGTDKGIPFYVVHVEGTSEEMVRKLHAERVVEGDAWLAGLNKEQF